MYTFTNQFISNENNLEYLKDNMMGPNAMRVAEELASYLNINEDMRILDLGCGSGLSTLLLAKKYGSCVFAADLWIPPTENHERFRAAGIDDKAVPVSVDATKGLPFANGYFDILFSVDAYHYFGDTKDMLPSLIPFVKKGGYIAVAVPGIKYEFGENVPDEMKPFWNDEVARTIHSLAWWKDLWSEAEGIEIADIREMNCCKQAWDEWLTSPNPYAVGDIKMMEAENGQYFNLVQLIAKVV
ncbi:MAG TPA: methyltransferase domain-containing protein [Desulfitobacteriaceae bacterium]|nr:methyltransferase domain-containing protein [Desulfitobacteriaceae bacterium]